MAYHPQTDGQSEHSNQWLEQYLRFWVDHQQTNWHHYLSLAEFAHNSWKNETTGQTPFEVLMGYTPRAEIFDVTSSILQWRCTSETGKSKRRSTTTHDQSPKEMGPKEDPRPNIQDRR